MSVKKIIFYKEWLKLDKDTISVLSLLIPTGKFSGNLSDMCRALDISIQTNNRNKLKQAINKLKDDNFIKCNKISKNWYIEIIKKEKGIELFYDLYEDIRTENYSSESVSWQIVLKVCIWVYQNSEEHVTRRQIANAIGGVSESTITAALNVLANELESIKREEYKEIINGNWRITGLTLCGNAWYSKKS